MADDLENWFATNFIQLMTLTLHLFYGKVKFGPLCFCMGKN